MKLEQRILGQERIQIPQRFTVDTHNKIDLEKLVSKIDAAETCHLQY